MSEAQQKYLCDAVAAVNDSKLFITVYRVNDGIDFASGRGETKHGSPRRHWTPDLIKREIAMVYGARTVELVQPPERPVSSSRKRSR
jgi:hypothetical protein